MSEMNTTGKLRKQTEIGEIPENWEVVQIGEIGRVVTGNTPKTSVPEYYGGPYMFIAPGDISEAQYITKTNKYVSAEGLKVLRPLPRDAILVVCIGTIGKTAMTSAEQSVTNQQINAIIPNARAFSHYVYYAVTHRSRSLLALAGRTVIPIVKKSSFAKFPIPLPPLPEQRAIAHILQTIQEAKAARQRELTLERERKAALMDHLFSYGTKGEPRKQTEIGEIPESWEVVRLGDIAEIAYGVQAAVAHLLDESIGAPILTNINITLEGTLDLSTLRYYELPENKRDKLILEKGDVLFNWRSGSQHHVGKTVLFDLDGEYTFSSFILRFRFVEKMQNEFALHYFHYLRKKGFFALKRSQSSVNSVFNASKSAEIPMVVPSIDEQSGISDVLQAFDTKTAALEQETERLDELFHAMLDELMTEKRSAVSLIDAESAQSA